MPASGSERDLLFGLLASQTGLVDQTALVTAFHARSGAGEKSLADVLGDRGALDAEGQALIQALVSKHLVAHGGDPEKCLGSLAAAASTREVLSRLGDPTATATLSHVDPDATADVDDGPTQPPGPAAAAGGQRFRPLRPHARGGLGAVFVALDTELNREVALKQILDRHADDLTSRSRFILEAEITGGLEHPGIVPVYGLGIHGDGRPYYAMRFIRGDSLKEAIAGFHSPPAATGPAGHADDRAGIVRPEVSRGSRDLELRKLLRRFLDVCNAIDYAHSRGVLHRDIKPANIVLGQHGETLVVDWGLAKVTGRGDPSAGEGAMMPRSGGGSAETLPGSTMGTPAYMSPEQARGEIDRLGPASDVYSLGATLYCLLTGRPPVQGDDLGSILRGVRQGEFPPPRQLDPRIDRPLEAVCLKALALEPGDRYASPRALADDVERWMADEPVSAMPESWGRRLARWSRRHRSATRAAAASLAAIATVATLAALAIGREQAQTRKALRAEQLARLDESKARVLAQEQSQLALDAIREYSTGVTREFLLRQPGMEDLRKSLLQAPTRFHRRLAQNIEHNGITDPGARARLGQAQLDLGEIINEIGTVEDSIVNFEQARDNLEQVVREAPDMPEYRFLLARTRGFLANRYDKANRPDAARATFDQALADFEHLARANHQDRRYRTGQAETLQLRADYHWDHAELDASRRDYLASVAIGAELVREYPDDLEILDRHGASLNNLSILFREAGEQEANVRTLTESTTLRERLVAATPADDPRRDLYLSNLGSCYGNLGSFHLDNGVLDEAAAWIRKALAIQDEQIKQRPNSVDYLERVGANHLNLGYLEFRTGRLATARTELEQARGYIERLLHVRPGDAVCRIRLVDCLGRLADVEDESGATTPGLDLTRRGMSEAEAILRLNPKYQPASQELTELLSREAELCLELGESDRAFADLDRAEAIHRELVASHTEGRYGRLHLAAAIRLHVRMDSELGRDRDDEPRLREAMALTEAALRDDPDLVMNAPDTALVDGDLAATLGRRGRPDEARALFARALDRLDRARARSPQDVLIRRTLARTLAARADLLRRLGQLRGSLDDWDRAIALAADTDALAFRLGRAATLALSIRLGRAATLALSSDYRAALAEADVADRSIDDRADLRMTSALAHTVLADAIRRDRSLTQAARAEGVATQVAAALERIGQARRSPAYRDARRLYQRLGDHDFDPLREQPAFAMLMRDLAFPAQPFAHQD